MEAIHGFSKFIRPDFAVELGEFKRVGSFFGIDESALLFVAEDEGELIELRDEIWSQLENNDDAYNLVRPGDWELVESILNQHVAEGGVPRDYKKLKTDLEQGISMQAPIIMKYGNTYHLVSGNTRLLVARALGLTPKAWLFEMYENEL